MKVFLTIILIVLCFPTAAQIDNKVDIELYTFGVGENYWEAFGHSALRVKINEIDYLYGFGYFDFDDEDFFLKFARGKMQYFLGIQETSLEIDDYIKQGRAIWSQKLDLSSLQKKQLISRLNFLAQGENRYYHYDYFLNNCTSQIRDLLDEVTNGEISKQLKGVQTNKSWNDLTFPVSNQSWMNLGIAIAYGIPAYQSRDKWSLSVFPEDFAHDLEQINTQTNWNGEMVQLHKAAKQLVKHSFIKTHYALIMLVSLILIGLLIPLLMKFTVYTWLIGQSLIGIALLFLWFFSEHSVAIWNVNLLLFFPFAFVFLSQKIFHRFNLFFLMSNILWLILAIFLTNLYLIGFSLANFLLYVKLKQIKNTH